MFHFVFCILDVCETFLIRLMRAHAGVQPVQKFQTCLLLIIILLLIHRFNDILMGSPADIHPQPKFVHIKEVWPVIEM